MLNSQGYVLTSEGAAIMVVPVAHSRCYKSEVLKYFCLIVCAVKYFTITVIIREERKGQHVDT